MRKHLNESSLKVIEDSSMIYRAALGPFTALRATSCTMTVISLDAIPGSAFYPRSPLL